MGRICRLLKNRGSGLSQQLYKLITEIWVQITTCLSFCSASLLVSFFITSSYESYYVYNNFQSSAKQRCCAEDHILWSLLCWRCLDTEYAPWFKISCGSWVSVFRTIHWTPLDETKHHSQECRLSVARCPKMVSVLYICQWYYSLVQAWDSWSCNSGWCRCQRL